MYSRGLPASGANCDSACLATDSFWAQMEALDVKTHVSRSLAPFMRANRARTRRYPGPVEFQAESQANEPAMDANC